MQVRVRPVLVNVGNREHNWLSSTVKEYVDILNFMTLNGWWKKLCPEAVNDCWGFPNQQDKLRNIHFLACKVLGERLFWGGWYQRSSWYLYFLLNWGGPEELTALDEPEDEEDIYICRETSADYYCSEEKDFWWQRIHLLHLFQDIHFMDRYLKFEHGMKAVMVPPWKEVYKDMQKEAPLFFTKSSTSHFTIYSFIRSPSVFIHDQHYSTKWKYKCFCAYWLSVYI